MLRKLLLWMSESEFLQNASTRWPLMEHMSRRFVAGETLEEAMKAGLEQIVGE